MCESPSTKCTKSVIPPTQMKSGFFSFCVFFLHPGFKLPPTKSSYPPKN